MARPARTARTGSSSRDCRAPKTAITASPICFSVMPPWAAMISSSFCQTVLMKSRTSSASRLWTKVVKPAKSANRTVICLRSPEGTATGDLDCGEANAATGWPQAGQKRAPGGNAVWQLRQRAVRAAPHLTQRRAVAEFSLPQDGQNMTWLPRVSRGSREEFSRKERKPKTKRERSRAALSGNNKRGGRGARRTKTVPIYHRPRALQAGGEAPWPAREISSDNRRADGREEPLCEVRQSCCPSPFCGGCRSTDRKSVA